MTEKQKLISLQGVRGIAFLGVFLYHASIIETGPWGVSVFVILSGFLMTYNYYDKKIEISLNRMVCFAKQIKQIVFASYRNDVVCCCFSNRTANNRLFFEI